MRVLMNLIMWIFLFKNTLFSQDYYVFICIVESVTYIQYHRPEIHKLKIGSLVTISTALVE